MEAEEERIRTSYDRGAVLRDLEIRWNVSEPFYPPAFEAPQFDARGPLPPINPEFARRFVDALRAEYLEGLGGAVEAFQDGAGYDESLGAIMEREEARVRDSYDRLAAIRDLEIRWNV